MKILIVEDEFVSRKKAQKILNEFGECDVAVNGDEALQAFIAAHDEGEPYDLITLDIQMPGIGGIEVLQSVRAWEDFHGIKLGEGVKIVMLTASKTPDAVMPSFKSGCEAYIIKPFNKEKLVRTLDELGF